MEMSRELLRLFHKNEPLDDNSRPSHLEVLSTLNLQLALEATGVFETANDAEVRKVVIKLLNTLVDAWIQCTSIEGSMSEEEVEVQGGRVHIFGSHLFGTALCNDVMNVLIVIPCRIQLNDFLDVFYRWLRSLECLTKCRNLKQNELPIIKFKCCGINVDLFCARVPLKNVRKDSVDLDYLDLYPHMDGLSKHSMNYYLTSKKILNQVPNEATFTLVLRAIKLWARRRGIYSHTLGFFGCTTWAILVARICLLMPNATASKVLIQFFLCYAKWDWRYPVKLKPLFPEDCELWDQMNLNAERPHAMPVMMPIHPEYNITTNITEDTAKLLRTEIYGGWGMVTLIHLGKVSWRKFFRKFKFFEIYCHYVVVKTTANNKRDHLMWDDWLKPRLPLLIQSLQKDSRIVLARLNPKKYEFLRHVHPHPRPQNIDRPYCSLWFIGLIFKSNPGANFDLTQYVIEFAGTIFPATLRAKVMSRQMRFNVRHVTRNELHNYLDEKTIQAETMEY